MEALIDNFYLPEVGIVNDITIATPGLMVFIGSIAGTYAATRKSRRDGLEPQLLIRVLVWLIIGLFVGGHLGYLFFYHPEELLNDPINLIKIWNGQSSFGGFILCSILGIWFFKSEKKQRERLIGKSLPVINIWSYADTIMYGFTLAWFFGRMGCFSVHDHPGVETTFWLGVYGICPGGQENIACHDLGFYEGIISLFLFLIFLRLDQRPRFPGFFVAILTTSYGVVRFLLDLLRHPDIDVRYFGLTPAQYGTLALIMLGIWVFITRRELKPERDQNKKN